MHYHKFSYPIKTGDTLSESVASGVKIGPKSCSPQVQAVLVEYTSVFSAKSTPVAKADLPPAEIITTCDVPLRKKRELHSSC